MGRMGNFFCVQVLAALVFMLSAVEGARILALIPMPARSHHIAFCAVTKALADKGHDVTLITGLDKDNKILPANNKVISVGNPTQKMSENKLKAFWKQEGSALQHVAALTALGERLVNYTAQHPLYQAEVNKPGQKYDLILCEAFFFQEAWVALGHHFNAPVVAFNPFGTSPQINEVMGNPVNPSWVASPFLGFSDHMTLKERVLNTLMFVAGSLTYNYYHLPSQQALADKFWPDAPPLQDLLRSRLVLTLVNNHFTLALPVPMSPNVVEIGGMHIIDKTKPLPKDLQEFMDSAKEGVVYFSMGSNLKTEHIPESIGVSIMNALGAINMKVLLKWDGPIKQKLSPNIRLIDWAPQSDLLAHPNLRVFITHGGLLSTQEAVYRGVPVVGIPVFGDQNFNMKLAIVKGFGVKVGLGELTEETLGNALKEVTQNPKYKQAAVRLSKLFRSKPIQPKDAAVFAIEHVLEHGGEHLRPSSVHLPLYQLLLLDVILAALVPVLMVVLCCRALCCGKAKKAALGSKSKKNN